MTDTVNIYEAKTTLCKLVDRAAAGEEIIIARVGEPKAKLVPYQPAWKKAPVQLIQPYHLTTASACAACNA